MLLSHYSQPSCYHRGNKVTDLLIYPAGLITQNTTYRTTAGSNFRTKFLQNPCLGFQLISIMQESLDCNYHCGR